MKAEEIRKVHCFFEQSGTFKNEFIKMGIPAEDYDIQNEFGQVDHVVDLFSDIEKEYAILERERERVLFLMMSQKMILLLLFFLVSIFVKNHN